MRALHVFPLLGAELTNGSDYYNYQISKAVAELGVHVDVLTTQSSRIRSTSMFSLGWSKDYDRGVECRDGFRIHRFPTSFEMPVWLGHLVSLFLLNQRHQEELRFGRMLPGSRNLVDYFVARTAQRPWHYDALKLIGLGPWSYPLLRDLTRRASDYDIFLVGFSPLALIWQITVLAKRLGKPVAIVPLFHPDDLYHHLRPLYWCFNNASGLLALSPYSAALFQRLFPRTLVYEVGAGVDAETFRSDLVSGQRFRDKYGLHGHRIVLYTARKEPGKRYDLAIGAVQRLSDPNVRLVMIGSDEDRVPITSDRVAFLGKISRADLVDAYEACDVFLMPSDHESFGMVFLEAWMRGKPVIGNAACRPVASLIKDGEDGFLCTSMEQIADRLSKLLNDPVLAKTMGETGKAKVLQRYTWAEVGRRVHAVYLDLIFGHRS